MAPLSTEHKLAPYATRQTAKELRSGIVGTIIKFVQSETAAQAKLKKVQRMPLSNGLTKSLHHYKNT